MTKVCVKRVTTVTYKLKDKYGRGKKLWNENWFGKWIRKHGKEARIPFITGRWKNTITRRVKWRQS